VFLLNIIRLEGINRLLLDILNLFYYCIFIRYKFCAPYVRFISAMSCLSDFVIEKYQASYIRTIINFFFFPIDAAEWNFSMPSAPSIALLSLLPLWIYRWSPCFLVHQDISITPSSSTLDWIHHVQVHRHLQLDRSISVFAPRINYFNGIKPTNNHILIFSCLPMIYLLSKSPFSWSGPAIVA
jgi:hypothetical protein